MTGRHRDHPDRKAPRGNAEALRAAPMRGGARRGFCAAGVIAMVMGPHQVSSTITEIWRVDFCSRWRLRRDSFFRAHPPAARHVRAQPRHPVEIEILVSQ